MIVHRCDRCKTIFEKPTDLFRLSLYKLGMPTLGNKIKYNKHICKKCVKVIYEVFNDGEKISVYSKNKKY